MHERKVEMAKRSVGFIGLPGGFGTFEEVCSVALRPANQADPFRLDRSWKSQPGLN